MINYSIIIPHKNIPNLLQRCLNSIHRRDDIQIIVVDDNSDPEEVDFDYFPGLGEECVEIYFTKEGRGAGYARNVGLEHAIGKWLLFADADDFFSEDFLYSLDDYKDSSYDIVYFSMTSIYTDTGEMAMRHEWNQSCIEEALLHNNYNLLKYKNTVPSAKIIRNLLVQQKNIRFDEVIAANDAMFSIKAAYYANSVIADRRVVYVITVRKGSLEHTISKKILLCRIEVDYVMNRFFKENGIKERVRVLRYILPLRKVSIIDFICQIFIYLFTKPLCFLSDFWYSFYSIFFRSDEQKKKNAKDYRYVKIESRR